LGSVCIARDSVKAALRQRVVLVHLPATDGVGQVSCFSGVERISAGWLTRRFTSASDRLDTLAGHLSASTTI